MFLDLSCWHPSIKCAVSTEAVRGAMFHLNHRFPIRRCVVLLDAIRQTLAEAIDAGGSSLRDYVHTDGGGGKFQLQSAVYGREGAPCRHCANPIRSIRQAGRSTYYCPACQR